MTPSPNPFLLVADGSPDLLPLLRSNPALASAQDEHGYSLLHAAASYDHLSILRTLVHEFNVSVDNIKDEDGETCLFVVETQAAAECLVEELGADVHIKNTDGVTAAEKIEQEGEFPAIANYLKHITSGRSQAAAGSANDTLATSTSDVTVPPPLPPNITVNVGTMPNPSETGQAGDDLEPDPEFRRRIEELASKDNFHTDEGQKELKDLITDAVRGVSREERDVRRRAG